MSFPLPETIVRTSHALTIRANGVAIGLINGWNPTISRTITPIYQIGTRVGDTNTGEPVEKVPGNVTGQTIAVQRYDLFPLMMTEAFGAVNFASTDVRMSMLSRQDRPFECFERWQFPDDQGGGSELVVYQGCWFSNLGLNYRSDGDRIVNVNATLEYTKRIISDG